MAADVKQLKRIFQECYSSFEYVPDKEQFGKDEHWTLPVPVNGRVRDDCDGFATYCRSKCRAAGIPSRLVICHTHPDRADPGSHLILEADGYCFDNRFPMLMTRKGLEKKGYRMLFISGFEPGDQWHQIKSSQ
jgi:predicted transglutaminase-like cysteine proteinase